MKQKTEDYKISAVKYYLKNNDNIRKTCKIFDCKKSSLQRWIKRYEISKNLTRKNRQPIYFVFQKFTLLVAINNSKRIGYKFYEKGGTTKGRMIEFLEKYIFGKFKNHLIILDNARSHHNDLIKEAIIKSGNQYFFSISYTPKTNAIEQYFNQLKYYLKKYRNVNNFQQLKENVKLLLDKNKTK